MVQITAYKVYTSGTSLAYCAVAGTVADGYVASGTAIYSDPFLVTQIATADGTDWKYVGEQSSWTQPTMTGNQMSIGGSVWGIYESGGQTGNLWKISDKNSSTYWDAGRPGLPINVIFYNPNPLLLTSVYFYNYSSDGINNYTFSGSNDNSTWTELSSGTGKGHNQEWTDTITTQTPYKYFKLSVSKTLDSSGWLNLREVTLTGTQYDVAEPVVSDLQTDSVKMYMMPNWTKQDDIGSWHVASTPSGSSFFSVAYGNGVYVATFGSGAYVRTSTDGATFGANITTGARGNLKKISYGNGLFVTGNNYADVVTSSDGTTWTSYQTGGYYGVQATCYGGGKWLAVCDGGEIYVSTDGTTWTQYTLTNSSEFLYGVCYGNGVYVAVGNSGGIYTSPDSETWTKKFSTSPSSILNNVAYGGGVYVAVSNAGKFYYSTDSETWTLATLVASGALQSVCWCGDRFIAVGYGGRMYQSADGATWTAITTGTTNTLNGVTYNGSGFGVVVGSNIVLNSDKSYTLDTSYYSIPALVDSNNSSVTYLVPAIAPAHPYAHYNGTIYTIDQAPTGAYPLTEVQYYNITALVNMGGTLAWYSNQRPYIYQYVSWTQPVLTTNTTTVTDLGNVTATASSYGNNSGGSASGNEYPYHAMDGVKSGSGTTYWGCNASSPAGQWWQVVFPYQIKITGLTHYNRYGNSYANVTGQFWTSSDRTTPIGDAFGATGATGWKATAIQNIPASGVVTDTIYFYITAGANYCGIGELEITATRYAILYEVPLTNFVS